MIGGPSVSSRDLILGRVRAALRDTPAVAAVPREYRPAGTNRADLEVLVDRLVDYKAEVYRVTSAEVAATAAAPALHDIGERHRAPQAAAAVIPELVGQSGAMEQVRQAVLRAAASPFQGVITSANRGSSGRRGRSVGAAIGSSCEDHPPPLDDAPDMVDSEMIKEMPIIGNVADDQVRLLTDFQRADAA